MSNPEGINQYTGGGSSKSKMDAAEKDSSIKRYNSNTAHAAVVASKKASTPQEHQAAGERRMALAASAYKEAAIARGSGYDPSTWVKSAEWHASAAKDHFKAAAKKSQYSSMHKTNYQDPSITDDLKKALSNPLMEQGGALVKSNK